MLSPATPPRSKDEPAAEPTAADKRALTFFLGGFAAAIALVVGLALWMR